MIWFFYSISIDLSLEWAWSLGDSGASIPAVGLCRPSKVSSAVLNLPVSQIPDSFPLPPCAACAVQLPSTSSFERPGCLSIPHHTAGEQQFSRVVLSAILSVVSVLQACCSCCHLGALLPDALSASQQTSRSMSSPSINLTEKTALPLTLLMSPLLWLASSELVSQVFATLLPSFCLSSRSCLRCVSSFWLLP